MNLKQTIVFALFAIPVGIAITIAGSLIAVGFGLGYLYAKGENVVARIAAAIRRMGVWNARH